EDGIRDLIVTGVQTCALPIWWRTRLSNPTQAGRFVPEQGNKLSLHRREGRTGKDGGRDEPSSTEERRCLLDSAGDSDYYTVGAEIGRASCRERFQFCYSSENQ